MDNDEELKIALEEARALDERSDLGRLETELDIWLGKNAVDIWATKPKVETTEEGEIIDGKLWPKASSLRDPEQVRKWGLDLFRACQELIVGNPELTTHQLQHMLSTNGNHKDILKYYPGVFEIIVQRNLDPPYYMYAFNKICDAQVRIRKGENVDKVEQDLTQYCLALKRNFARRKSSKS